MLSLSLGLLLAMPAVQDAPSYDHPRVTPIVLVARKAAPAVVYIEAVRPRAVLDIFGRRRVDWETVGGSGVVVDKSGYIVTNHHVVGTDAREYYATLFEEGEEPRRMPAKLISNAPSDDLALLKIEAGHDLPVITRGTSSDLMLGETVVAIGNPLGQTKTVSAGIISGLDRDLEVPHVDPPLKFHGLIQTDAAINPGNSGGPLLNILGEMIGINTAIRPGAENIGFAIPVDRVEEVLSDLLSPQASQAWFGFEVDDRSTLCVNQVAPGSPADVAGMEVGYKLLAINGEPIRDGDAYRRIRLPLTPGQDTSFTLAGPTGDRTFVIRGWDRARGTVFARTGMTVDTLAIGALETWLRVREVAAKGPAKELGLESGDIIDAMRVVGERHAYRPRSPADLADFLAPLAAGVEVQVDVLRDDDGNRRLDLRSEMLRGVLTLR